MNKRLTAALGAALCAATLTACAADNPEPAAPHVVTSTGVWADVAREVITDATPVDAIITDATIDPHSFEPTASDLAGALKASLVVVGGGAYDGWLSETVAEHTSAPIAHALPLPDGDGHHDHDTNEHIWYDLDAVRDVGQQIADAAQPLGIAADPAPLTTRVDALRAALHALPSATVAQTETAADYLIADTALEDRTPAGYHHAMMNHATPAAADLAEFLDLINSGTLDILLYNPNTATDTTERLRAAAEARGVAVVSIAEIPDPGTSFLDYYATVIDNLRAALRAS